MEWNKVEWAVFHLRALQKIYPKGRLRLKVLLKSVGLEEVLLRVAAGLLLQALLQCLLKLNSRCSVRS
jgi:hypothetical protein